MNKLRVFIISSDKTLVGARGIGDAVSRHAQYGKRVESIDILVYTNKKENFRAFSISQNVKGIPSNSISKITFFFDALRIFKEINKERKISLIVSQDPFVFGLTGWWLKKKYNIRLIINFHGDFWENKFWLKERFLNRIFLLVSYFIVKKADGLRVVNSSIKSKLIKNGISENKIAVIPTAVNQENFESVDEPAVSKLKEFYKNKKIILFVGRFHKEKNIPLLIKSFALVREKFESTVLVLIGDGPEKDNILNLMNELSLKPEQDVFLVGLLSHNELPKYYKAAHVIVLPSLFEGRPKVVIEGALTGTVTVAVKAPWSEEINRHGINLYLVSLDGNNNEEKFSKQIISLLKEEELKERTSENLKKAAKEYVDGSQEGLVEFWGKTCAV